MSDVGVGPVGGYRLERLGWLQFERLASLVLAEEAGLDDLDWSASADTGRSAWSRGPVRLLGEAVRSPAVIAVAWVPAAAHDHRSLLAKHLRVIADRVAPDSSDGVVVVTNLASAEAREVVRASPLGRLAAVVVLAADELSESLDRHAGLRLAMPSVLGLRDLDALIPEPLREGSSLDVARARALARVFVPTGAYERACRVLQRHAFVVLTGPPEMGKTAIAQMIALARMTSGWEAHDCTSPQQIWGALDTARPQVFVADDAFGSTEYRPDTAEQWACELGRMLAVLDDTHWLIWTSRPAPLRAALRRVQRERGAERFPAPGEVLVDASALDRAEKTLILFRHVKDREVNTTTRQLIRRTGPSVVEHPHFTPERIRRFAAGTLNEVTDAAELTVAVERALATPTREMTTSFAALEPEHRALLIALLDTPAGLTDERELSDTLRRHYPAGLSHPPHELIDRLTDHFLRLSSLGIDWVHPSWRDLVIDRLREDATERRSFLRRCGTYGALLALSGGGGVSGERELPLLIDDADWDALTDRLGELLRELEDATLRVCCSLAAS